MATAEDIARTYLRRGWVPIALGFDKQGKPKRPLVSGWTGLRQQTALSQPWSEAKGVGLLCGRASGGLAVIDIDHPGLAMDLMCWLIYGRQAFYWVKTGRWNGHLYITEREPSESRRFRVRYRQEELGVELRCDGNQVAAPPTPGYEIVRRRDVSMPATARNVGEVWRAIELRFGLESSGQQSGAGYPKPWADLTPGERNNSAYSDAHALARAGMDIHEALRILRIRFDSEIGKGFSERELEASVHSAYTKRAREHRDDYVGREIDW